MVRTSKNNTTSKGSKKGIKRGPYKKKNIVPEEQPSTAGEWIYDNTSSPLPKEQSPAMPEIELLAIFCDNFGRFDTDTQQRTWNYLKSRYDKYFI